MRNPHFDDDRIIWNDSYSGVYAPPTYSEQFDLQWKLALQGNKDYYNNPGTSVENHYIDDRVYEWTGIHPSGNKAFNDPSMGSRVLDHTIDPSLIAGKSCVDIGCGVGRWTRAMQRIGAKDVLSIDISDNAIKSVSRFNNNVLKTNIMELDKDHPELTGKFDFGNLWGVAMHTHDPMKAFISAAQLIKQGGALYLMVYHPEGLHGMKHTTAVRKKFHALRTIEERLNFVEAVRNRKWDKDVPLIDNLKNVTRNLRHLPKGSSMGWLDLLETYYNWVIPAAVIEGWFNKAGFKTVTFLNEFEKGKCAHHVLGVK